MGLPGGTVLKVLAVAAAVLTVPTGVPSVRCVCPDGRVKLLCSGQAASGCCCSASTTPADGSPHGCCWAGATAPAGHTHRAPGASAAVTACGCERSVVAGVVPPAVKEVEDDTRVEMTGLLAGAAFVTAAPLAVHRVLASRGLLTPPPDLVLVYCHFTC
ncbi:MAG: hypothetical protein K2X87_19950 [Gemmataceae bacterium]|nr:hypothetical protein [Gemmataceae bacterium]